MNQLIAETNFAPANIHPVSEIHILEPIRQNVAAIPFSPLYRKKNLVIKRFFDISLSIILIICLLSWLLPVLALIIKLNSRGPVFFVQKRNRNKGKYFNCIKFRSMIVNDEADLLVAQENDSRITSVGRWLRKYHLDELPQLFNVLFGDMSLIGPRPYMVIENKKYETIFHAYSYRHSVKPGITGLAQSFGYFGSMNDLEEVKERMSLDIEYIHKWSLLMDVKILFRTISNAAGRQAESKT